MKEWRGVIMRESQIEARLVQGVKAKGGMCMKFTSPGLPGVPDRIVLTPAGSVYFVELKTEIGRLANIQKWVIEEMRKRGADVRVVKGPDAVKEFLKEVFPA
jgi:hypothetical protein